MDLKIGDPYTRAGLADIFALPRLAGTREGVVTHSDDVILFVTLDKTAQENKQLHYNDFFEGALFHWDSQTTQHYQTPVIQNMVHGRVTIHLFARIHQKVRGETQPFFYCGQLGFHRYDPSTSRPVHIVFKVLKLVANPNADVARLYAWRPNVASVYAQTTPSVGPASRAPTTPPSQIIQTVATSAPQPVRLNAQALQAATPEYIWRAIQDLLAGRAVHRFGPSTDYDLITDDGQRLPPKAVFGMALAMALNEARIGPEHFSAGETSPCFRLLREAGYAVVPKSSPHQESGAKDREEEREWFEGSLSLKPHWRRERAPGLAMAKKSQFMRLNGRLFCERCLIDPVAVYGTPLAASCIEVHHKETQVQDMAPAHSTRLRHLMCICANCHRLEHRRLATGADASLEDSPT